MFSRILVPTDFSPSADAALSLARDNFPEAVMCLLHVLDPAVIASSLTSPVASRQNREELERELLARLDRLARPFDECSVEVGSPVESILAKTESWQPDLIVMGTHGRTGLAHFLNGSVAERVVRYSRCPVLIEHEKK